MPLWRDDESIAWEDPDLVPRPVLTLGAAGVDRSAPRAGTTDPLAIGEDEAFHAHRKGQCLLWLRGVLTCEVDGGFWLVPPGSAIWVPGGVRHRMQTAGTVECYVVYVAPAACHGLPDVCCTLSTSPLLRELIIRSAHLPMRYEEGGMGSRIMALLLDELALAQPGQVHLPLHGEPRLRKLVDAIMANPSMPGTIESWSQRLALSPRTLSRLVVRETGMSFGRWQRQLHIMLALQWLARGATVEDIAIGLGYNNPSNFIVMFRKALGETPARYLKSKVDRLAPR